MRIMIRAVSLRRAEVAVPAGRIARTDIYMMAGEALSESRPESLPPNFHKTKKNVPSSWLKYRNLCRSSAALSEDEGSASHKQHASDKKAQPGSDISQSKKRTQGRGKSQRGALPGPSEKYSSMDACMAKAGCMPSQLLQSQAVLSNGPEVSKKVDTCCTCPL